MLSNPSQDLPDPFGNPAPALSDSQLRQTAYEILILSCRSSGTKPLTWADKGQQSSAAATLQRSLTAAAASEVKKVLGLKAGSQRGGGGLVSNGGTVGELIRMQMKVSERDYSRVRRALLRISSGQLGRRIESIVLPLELLQQFKPSDFSNVQEYDAWQRRNLKVIEAGLLVHPYLPLDKKYTAPKELGQIIQDALEKPTETENNDLMQILRTIVMSLACRTCDGSVSDRCHWADGLPFNLRIYNMLLEACFNVDDETFIIDEVDDVLELIKKTWVTLGINQMYHNLCFMWTLFHRYISTAQVESDLLFASCNLLVEVEKDAKKTNDPDYSEILGSVLSSMLSWAEQQLLSYRDTFNSDNTEMFESVLSLGVVAAKILIEDLSHEFLRKRKGVDVAVDRVETYIRSSLRAAFSQIMEMSNSSKKLSRKAQNNSPSLASAAQDITILAFDEKGIFSPILKKWHPLPAGVAVATLHTCYGNELRKFISGVTELTPDAIQVLQAAEKLEKDLMQIVVMDAEDSEDGGKSIIQEMPPYEAEIIIADLVRSWIKTRIDMLKEWVDRNLQQKIWNPKANKEHIAPSAVEVLRMLNEILDAFFLLPITMHSALLSDLATGLDGCLQYCVVETKSGCGSRNTFVPPLPALTRCTTGLKLHGVLKRKERTQMAHKKLQVLSSTEHSAVGIPQLCVRINTLQHIRGVMEIFEDRIATHLMKLESSSDYHMNGGKFFELSPSSCVEGIKQLCEATAYKIIFHDLNHVLWDSLYVGEVQNSRIEPFLQELEQYLEIISSTVHERVRTRVITETMRASFEGFLLVLLAGGPSRAFTLQHSTVIEEDFKFLRDLFWSDGDGLPINLIDKFSTTINCILPLFRIDTESLIARFRNMILEDYGSTNKSKLPMPPTTGQWNPTDANTLLRVLCYRNDETASKFLKKTYNLRKKL